MLQNLGGVHLIVIVGIVLLLFGAPKLPALAKSLGQSMRILKTEVRGDENNETDALALNADEPTPAGPASSVRPPKTQEN